MKHLFSLIILALVSTLSRSQCPINFTVDSIPATCAGSCDGSIIVGIDNDGTSAAPYVVIFENSLGITVGTYTFFSDSGDYTFPGVCAEMHTVSIQSILDPGCFLQTTIDVTEPSPILFSTDVVHETDGLANGEITINASGGIPPYQYSIDNGNTYQSSNLFTGLAEGTYDVVLQDNNGCTLSEVVSVGLMTSTGCEVVVDATAQPVSCFGTCDGQIVLEYENLQMGSPGAPYTVTITDGDGNLVDLQVHSTEIQTVLFDNLCADTYTISVQGASCSFLIGASVQSPSGMALYVNTIDPSFGETDGTAELVVIGGVPGYQYSLDGGIAYQLSPSFSGLDEGTYLAMVQDANGCLQDVEFTLEDPATCSLSVTSTVLAVPSCYGSCEGSISYTYSDSGEHPGYHIMLVKDGIPVQTASQNGPDGTGSFDNLCAGIYEVRVTDGWNCLATVSVTLIQPPALQVTAVNTTGSDPGMDNGTATVSATGGQAPNTYSLDGITFSGSAVFTDLPQGVYSAWVQDSEGCTHEWPFVINEDSGCDFNIMTSIDPASCTGSCDGAIGYTFGGTASDTPFSLVLESGGMVVETATSPVTSVMGSFPGLCPGVYVLTVGNSSGCEQMVAAVVEQPSVLNISATAQTASTGNNDGAIIVTVSGGVAPYEYSIDNQATWQTSSTINGVGAGFYTTWVKDAGGCTALYTVEVDDTSGCSFIVDITTSATTCWDDCDGMLACTFNDPAVNPPYAMRLYNGSMLIGASGPFPDFSGLDQFTDLCAGGYTIVVEDANGCTDEQQVLLHGPDPIDVTTVNLVESTPGNADGSAELIVTGGVAPYEFTINDGVTWQYENTFTSLDSGFYGFMIKDASGCFFFNGFAINEQPGCDIDITFEQIADMPCNDSSYAIIQYEFTEVVNTPPYLVEWIFNSEVAKDTVYSTNSLSGFWDSLGTGIFGFAVTNGNGCKSVVPSLWIQKPPKLILSGIITGTSSGLDNGAIELTATGGNGLHVFSLDTANNGTQTSPFFENLAPGSYVAYVIDENDCSDTLNFEIFDDPGCHITVTALADALSPCAGDCNGAISFDYADANVNPPYSVLLTNSSGAGTGSSVETGSTGAGLFTGLCAGDYTLTVTDASGCQSAGVVSTIAQPTYVQVDLDLVHPTDGYYNGSITLNPSGGTPPYEYSTDNQATWSSTNSWSTLSAGFYIIYVRDGNGCVQVVCVVLVNDFDASLAVVSSNISVYPNPTQGLVMVDANDVQSVRVYDLNGRLIGLPEVAASNGVVLDLSAVQDGVYVLEITSGSGEVLYTRVVKD